MYEYVEKVYEMIPDATKRKYGYSEKSTAVVRFIYDNPELFKEESLLFVVIKGTPRAFSSKAKVDVSTFQTVLEADAYRQDAIRELRNKKNCVLSPVMVYNKKDISDDPLAKQFAAEIANLLKEAWLHE